METKPCPQCGGPIVRLERWRPSYWAQKQYCSRKCAGLALNSPGPRPCVQCGQPIRQRGTRRRYCSTTCYDADRVAGSVMDERKLGRSRARRGFAARPCEVCGSVSTGPGRAGLIHRHHRDGDQTNNDPSNIGFLCKPHHDDAHSVMAARGAGRSRGGARPRVTAMLRDRAQAQAALAAGLRAQGLSSPAIAAALGVNRRTVTRWLEKYSV